MPESTADLTRTVELPDGRVFTVSTVRFDRFADLQRFVSSQLDPVTQLVADSDRAAAFATAGKALTDPAAFEAVMKLADGHVEPAIDPAAMSWVDGINVLAAFLLHNVDQAKAVLGPLVGNMMAKTSSTEQTTEAAESPAPSPTT